MSSTCLTGWPEDVALAQQLLLDRYRSLRQYLFEFLASHSDAETWLDQWALHLSSSLAGAAARQFDLLLSQGKTIIGEATAQARKMVQEQATAPIVDVVTLDANGAVIETDTSFPLFPVVPREDREQFCSSVGKLTQWYQEMAAFIDELKGLQNDVQNEEA